ncbi:transcription initiation factor IID, 18kD subunit-domain-containing protein [Gorgonomyces haynaldii]|nr:transcription initiation factor IID, 18kD subunit-domain-containing protein [Gorgonomyces haynaldii]
MMFVFGEVADTIDETTQLVEEIVKTQLMEIIGQAVQFMAKKGSKASLSAEDLIFMTRNDRGRVNRLRTFLSWKDVRRKAKEEKAEDEALLDEPDKGKIQKLNVKFTFDPLYNYSQILSDDDDEDQDEDEKLAFEEQANRLRQADEYTRTMTKDQYIYFSECRQASFTYKKAKKFRDWLEMSKFLDSKPSADVIDILGFMACELVSKITETSLRVKREWDQRARMDKKAVSVSEMRFFLFDRPDDAQTPLQPQHIQEAFRQLQRTRTPLKTFKRAWPKGDLQLI